MSDSRARPPSATSARQWVAAPRSRPGAPLTDSWPHDWARQGGGDRPGRRARAWRGRHLVAGKKTALSATTSPPHDRTLVPLACASRRRLPRPAGGGGRAPRAAGRARATPPPQSPPWMRAGGWRPAGAALAWGVGAPTGDHRPRHTAAVHVSWARRGGDPRGGCRRRRGRRWGRAPLGAQGEGGALAVAAITAIMDVVGGRLGAARVRAAAGTAAHRQLCRSFSAPAASPLGQASRPLHRGTPGW